MRFVKSDIRVGGTPVMHILRETLYRKNVKGDFVVCWGWRQARIYRSVFKVVLMVERGYLGDRLKEWVSLAWNGLNGRGDFRLPETVTFDRFRKNFGELNPWKEDGKYILVMGQIAGDASLGRVDLTSWYEMIAKTLKEKYGKPVFFRPHPHTKPGKKNFMPKIPVHSVPLQEALDEAFAVVTYNSNSAVDAVISGIPAWSFDEGSMAYAVTSHDVHVVVRPEREEWAARLAHCQWSLDELVSGEWVDRLFG